MFEACLFLLMERKIKKSSNVSLETNNPTRTDSERCLANSHTFTHDLGTAPFFLVQVSPLTNLFSMDDKQNGEIRVSKDLDFENFTSGSAFVSYHIFVWVSPPETLGCLVISVTLRFNNALLLSLGGSVDI